MWTSQKILMLKSDCFQRKKRTRNFIKSSMWKMNLKNLSIYLMWGILYSIKILLINSIVMSYKSIFTDLPSWFFSIRIRMSWRIGDNRNLFVKLKSKMGLFIVVLTTPKTSPQKHTKTLIEKQQLPDIEKTDSRKDFSCLSWTTYIGKRKVWVNFKTDTDELSIAV